MVCSLAPLDRCWTGAPLKYENKFFEIVKKITQVRAEELVRSAKKRINKVNIVLDVGCGIRPQKLTRTFIHFCLDAHKQYLDVLKTNVVNRDLIKGTLKYFFLNKTIDYVIEKFPHKQVDTVFLLDVIEHLDKSKGIELLKSFEKIARHQIVVFTPLGFVNQEHPDGRDAWGLDGGKWQEHKSGWTPDDFDESWEFIVCDDFHTSSNMGDKHAAPVGAFFAIKTLDKQPKLVSKSGYGAKVIFWFKSYFFYRSLN